MRSVRLAAAACALACAPSAAQACSIPRGNWNFGADSQATMTVKSGQLCASSLQLGSGRDAEGPRLLESATVGTQARNGAAGVSGTRWQYQSKPGFKGRDSFVLILVGGSMFGQKMTTNLSVDVEVQ